MLRRKLAAALRRGARRLEFSLSGVESRPAHVFRGSDTTLELYLAGRGDRMIGRQIGQAFARHLERRGDPDLGRIILSCGGYGSSSERGDVNLYWWWSFGPMDDEPDRWLDHYLDTVDVPPDVILCPSERTLEAARAAGFEVVYLPLGAGPDFRPLGLERSGLGYAGTPWHKPDAERERILGPWLESGELDWVSDIETPAGLNLWYNTKLVTLGTTLPGQRAWGMVNNRVFEALASGTPLVCSRHDGLEETLGFEYPLQASSVEETRELVRRVRERPGATLERCREWSRRVREEHSYERRLSTLFEALEARPLP